MQRRMVSGVEASSSRRSFSPPQDEEEEENIIYSCAPKEVLLWTQPSLKLL